MGNVRTYANAPITEAIIVLVVEPPAAISWDVLARCHDGEEENYPTPIQSLGVPITRGTQRDTVIQQTCFVYTSADQKQVYQVRFDGFSFNRLAPYESWTPFCNEARRLWQKYRDCLKPVAVTRLGVRFVNRIDIPGDRVEIKDYLRVMPEIGEDFVQKLEGYFMQLQIPMGDAFKLLLSETIAESPKPGCVSLILDIDLTRPKDIPQAEGGIWELFETLHLRKNEIFEACITDRTRELFQ